MNRKTDRITVVGIGEILWDVFPDRRVMGGAPANFAYHASQLGLDGYAVSAVGNDEPGSEILLELERKNLNHVIETVEFPTGTVEVSLDDNGVPSYEIKQNVAWDNMPFSDCIRTLAGNTQAVCFGSLAQRSPVSRRTIRNFINNMPAGSLRIFDINLRQKFYTKGNIEESLQMSDMLKINEDEIVVVSEMFGFGSNEEAVCRILMEYYGLKIVALTKGASCSYIFTKDETSFLPTPRVQVADTVGAGDAFTAAFTAAYLDGKSITDAHRLAVDTSAFVCRHYGAMPKLDDLYGIGL